jgi:hypothetical protein
VEGEVRTGGKNRICEKRLGKWEKMVEGFSDTISRFFLGNISTLLFELLDDLENGVGRAGEVMAEFGLKHR